MALTAGGPGRGPRWVVRVRGLLALALLSAGTLAAANFDHLVVLIPLLVVTAAGWGLTYGTVDPPPHVTIIGTALLGGAGVAMAVIGPSGTAVAFAGIACFVTGLRLALPWPILLPALMIGGFEASAPSAGRGAVWTLSVPGVLVLCVLLGLVRRQNDRLATESALVRDEQAHTAALAERARIAREIHDVLAHSLAALTVQLETADALLESDRPEQARRLVVGAGQLAREGLAETRRAIGALRGDAVVLPEAIEALAAAYRADLAAPAEVTCDGVPRELPPDAGLALYRVAQEAMTNVRKHAPGAPVTIALRYRPDEASLTVANGPAPAGATRSLSGTGGGYGLTGLRERAELNGGTFHAGESAGGWRIEVTIPTAAREGEA